MQEAKTNTENREISIARTLNAPIEQVWEAWINPDHIAKWWGPNEFTTSIHKMEINEGGEWLLTIHGPDGKNYPNKSVFVEMVPFKKFVYQHFNPSFLGTVIFESKEKQTLMNWTMLFETAELFEIVVKTFKADEGLKQNGEKLERYLQEMKTH